MVKIFRRVVPKLVTGEVYWQSGRWPHFPLLPVYTNGYQTRGGPVLLKQCRNCPTLYWQPAASARHSCR